VKACFALDAGWIPVRVKKTHQEGLLRRCSSRSQYAAAQEGKSMRLRINVRGFDAVCRMVQANMGVGLIPDRAFEVVGAATLPSRMITASPDRLLAIHHPGRTEFVCHHAEALGPKCLPDRHYYRAAFRELTENPLGFGRIIYRDAYAETLRFRRAMRWRVSPHQQTSADLEPCMHDAIGGFGILRNTRTGRRVRMAHHHQDLALEHFLVAFECFLTSAIEA
jgi:hypothetical protein